MVVQKINNIDKDLGNIISKNGKVSMTMRDKLIKLNSKYSIIGRSVVIHAKEDDLERVEIRSLII